MLESLKNETQRTATQMAQSLSKIGDGFKSSASHIEHLTSATQRLYSDGSITLTEKGFDKLNRTITDVYRNGQLVSKTLKSDSALTKDIAYANELYAEQVAHLKRIYDLKDQRTKVSDGSDQAHNLDGQLADTERLLEMNNKIIQQLDGQAVARSKLVDLGKEEARLMQRQDARAFSGANELAQAQRAYTQLTSSIRNYNQAVKTGNEAGKAYWSQSAQSAAAEMDSIEAKVGTLEIEETARKRILDLIQKAKDANLNADAQGLHDTVDKIGSKLVQMLITATALRALKNTWQHAIEYGKKYYDLLNEIRIVSG